MKRTPLRRKTPLRSRTRLKTKSRLRRKKPINQRSKKQRKRMTRDAKVKARLKEIYGDQCFFGVRGLKCCQDWTPEDRQPIEQMHIYGKYTETGYDARFDVGFSFLGCWYAHNMHHAGILKLTAEFSPDKSEVYRTAESGDWFFDDYAASELIPEAEKV